MYSTTKLLGVLNLWLYSSPFNKYTKEKLVFKCCTFILQTVKNNIIQIVDSYQGNLL